MQAVVKLVPTENYIRTHLALGKETPKPRPVQRVGRIVSVPLLGSLHHRYVQI